MSFDSLALGVKEYFLNVVRAMERDKKCANEAHTQQRRKGEVDKISIPSQ